MRIEFTIPDAQPIDVVIDRNWFTGSFTCKANGKTHEIKDPLALGTHFSVATTHNYTVNIGDHLIEIEHSRPRFFGGVRPQRYIVKVDEKLVHDQTGF
jgi:hypothetical protein